MMCEWIIPCEKVTLSPHGNPSIINVMNIAHVKRDMTPIQTEMAFALRMSGSPNESGTYNLSIADPHNEEIGRHRSAVTIPADQAAVDGSCVVRVTFRAFGVHTATLTVGGGDDAHSRSVRFYLAPYTAH